MEQDIEDGKLPKSGGKDSADVEDPLVQKTNCKMSRINVDEVVSNTKVSG